MAVGRRVNKSRILGAAGGHPAARGPDLVPWPGRGADRGAGVVEVEVGSSSADLRLTGSLLLHEPERVVGRDRVLTTPVSVLDAG